VQETHGFAYPRSFNADAERNASLPQRGTTIAAIRKRRNKYEAQVRRARLPHISKTFRVLKRAQAWAEQTELPADPRPSIPRLRSGMQGGLV
jgi:hypothetical protein